jgi:hypothetical protein
MSLNLSEVNCIWQYFGICVWDRTEKGTEQVPCKPEGCKFQETRTKPKTEKEKA